MIRMLPILLLICLGLAVIMSVLIWPSKPKAKRNVFDYRPEPLELAQTEHQRALIKIASDEHALGLLPHNDSNVTDVCTQCVDPGLVKDPNGKSFYTPNEVREIRQKRAEAQAKREFRGIFHGETPMHDKNGYP